jgi:hypothetical protein
VKIRRPPPKGILDRPEDFVELKHWLESDPDVPSGKWYKRFRRFTLAGSGAVPSTFLTPGMSVDDEEVE